jgi:hypothetical protein
MKMACVGFCKTTDVGEHNWTECDEYLHLLFYNLGLLVQMRILFLLVEVGLHIMYLEFSKKKYFDKYVTLSILPDAGQMRSRSLMVRRWWLFWDRSHSGHARVARPSEGCLTQASGPP